MIAAQLWASLEKDHPTARDDMRNGRFVEINDWRRDKIWSEASRYSTPELLVKATGEKLNGTYFEEHLKRRYLRLSQRHAASRTSLHVSTAAARSCRHARPASRARSGAPCQCRRPRAAS